MRRLSAVAQRRSIWCCWQQAILSVSRLVSPTHHPPIWASWDPIGPPHRTAGPPRAPSRRHAVSPSHAGPLNPASIPSSAARTGRQQQVAGLGEEAYRVDALVVPLPGVDPALGQVGAVRLVALVTRRRNPRAALRETTDTRETRKHTGDRHAGCTRSSQREWVRERTPSALLLWNGGMLMLAW